MSKLVYYIPQHAEKLSSSLGLVDIPVGQVDSVNHLPNWKVKFLGEMFEETLITD